MQGFLELIFKMLGASAENAQALASYGFIGLITFLVFFIGKKFGWKLFKQYLVKRADLESTNQLIWTGISDSIKANNEILSGYIQTHRADMESFHVRINHIDAQLAKISEVDQLLLTEASGTLDDTLTISTVGAYTNLIMYRIGEFYDLRLKHNHIVQFPKEIERKYHDYAITLGDKFESQLFKYRYKSQHVSEWLVGKTGHVALGLILKDLYTLHYKFGQGETSGVLMDAEDMVAIKNHLEHCTSWFMGGISRWCSSGTTLAEYMTKHPIPSTTMQKQEIDFLEVVNEQT